MALPRPKIAILGYNLEAAHRLASMVAALGAEPFVLREPGETLDAVLGVAADYRLAAQHGVSEVARVVGDRNIPAVALVSEFTGAEVRRANQCGIRLTKAPGARARSKPPWPSSLSTQRPGHHRASSWPPDRRPVLGRSWSPQGLPPTAFMPATPKILDSYGFGYYSEGFSRRSARVAQEAAMKVAFALAGLGGFNAHGAGFLVAAHEAGLMPNLVTATTGQVGILARWIIDPTLEDFVGSLQGDLEKNTGVSAHQIDDMQEFLTDMRQVAELVWDGLPGKFRPAREEFFLRWLKLPFPPRLEDLKNCAVPAQLLVPEFPEAELAKWAEALSSAKFGVVFNGYNPKTGKGVLFGNNEAAKILPEIADSLLPITANSVMSAVWLYFYGFDKIPNGIMDGAYHRSCIVAELSKFDRIFVPHPVSSGWGDDLPSNWFEVEDWKTEMWFSASYKAEVADMERTNHVIKKLREADPKLSDFVNKAMLKADYREIDLVQIELATPCGFFNYMKERRSVFLNAKDKSRAAIDARR